MSRRDLLLGLLLILATVATYGRVLSLGFVSYDDPLYVTENPHVRGGIAAEGVVWAFTTHEASNYYHPLAWLSHMLDVQLYGLDPAGHHLTSLLLHVTSSFLLFLLLARGTGAHAPSLLVALLFALHPLHVESVAWLAERKDVLSTLFFWLTLSAYVHYVERPGPLRYGMVAVLYALGLLAKPMLVTLPFVLLLLDLWPLGRLRRLTGAFAGASTPSLIEEHDGHAVDSQSRAGGSRSGEKTGEKAASFGPLLEKATSFGPVLEKVPLLLLAAGSALMTMRLSARAVLPLDRLSLGARFANAVTAYATYIVKGIWPARLAVIYPHPGMPPSWKLGASAALLLGITAWAFRERRRRPYIMFGWLWYLVTLVPVIGLVQVGSQALADRYTYVPLTGLFIVAAWGTRELSARLGGSHKVWCTAWGAVVLACAAAAWVQIGYWKNSLTLFEHALSVTDDNVIAHVALGNALGAAGRLEEASVHYAEALRIAPAYSLAHYNLAMNLLKQRRIDEAIDHFNECLRMEPGHAEAHQNLGFALYRKGRVEEALAHYADCLHLEPDSPFALNNLAWIRATNNDQRFRDGPEAVRLAERACSLTRRANPRFLSTLAAAYAEAGRFGEAVQAIDRAIALARGARQSEAVREYSIQEDLYRSGRPLRVGTGASR